MCGQREHDVSRPAAGGVDGEKKSLIATEQDPIARAAWWEAMADIPAARLVFVDETGTHTRMTPLYARAPRGERAYGHVPRNHARNTTLVAALTLAGLDAPMVREGAMDREACVAGCPLGSMRQSLVPTLHVGQVVVMDNLNVPKGGAVRAIIEGAGCALVYRPAYSPDFAPIEGAYSTVKTRVRRAGKRSQGALEAAIGEAVSAVTARDAAGWFAHCGYRLPGQPS
jgi:transposase